MRFQARTTYEPGKAKTRRYCGGETLCKPVQYWACGCRRYPGIKDKWAHPIRRVHRRATGPLQLHAPPGQDRAPRRDAAYGTFCKGCRWSPEPRRNECSLEPLGPPAWLIPERIVPPAAGHRRTVAERPFQARRHPSALPRHVKQRRSMARSLGVAGPMSAAMAASRRSVPAQLHQLARRIPVNGAMSRKSRG